MRAAAGIDYPSSYAELRAWFDQDWKCLGYLDSGCAGLTGSFAQLHLTLQPRTALAQPAQPP